MRVLHKKLILFLVGLLVIGYGFWQARDFLGGPKLYLENPKEGETLGKEILTIKGMAQDVTRLTLNGRAIFTDEAGRFEEEILVSPGVNIIELRAEDKFGHERLVRRTILVE
jgi:hypothetical protein